MNLSKVRAELRLVELYVDTHSRRREVGSRDPAFIDARRALLGARESHASAPTTLESWTHSSNRTEAQTHLVLAVCVKRTSEKLLGADPHVVELGAHGERDVKRRVTRVEHLDVLGAAFLLEPLVETPRVELVHFAVGHGLNGLGLGPLGAPAFPPSRD